MSDLDQMFAELEAESSETKSIDSLFDEIEQEEQQNVIRRAVTNPLNAIGLIQKGLQTGLEAGVYSQKKEVLANQTLQAREERVGGNLLQGAVTLAERALQPLAAVGNALQRPRIEPPMIGTPITNPEAGFGTGFAVEAGERSGLFPKAIAQGGSALLKTLGTLSTVLPPMEQDIAGRRMAEPVTRDSSLNALERNPLIRAGKAVDASLERVFPEPPSRDIWHDFVSGAGNVAGLVGTGAAGKAVGLGTKAATFLSTAVGSGMEFDDAFDRAIAKGNSPDEAAAKAFGYATVAGAIENRLGVGRILRKYFPSPEAAVQKLTAMGVSKNLIKEAVVGGFEEGSQEAAEGLIVEGKLDPGAIGHSSLVGSMVQGTAMMPGVGGRYQAAPPKLPPVEGLADRPRVFPPVGEPAAPIERVSPGQALEAADRMQRTATAGYAQPVIRRPRQRVEVPVYDTPVSEQGRFPDEIPAEPKPLVNGPVIRTFEEAVEALRMRGKGTETRAEIAALMPEMSFKSEGAAVLARAAWGDQWMPKGQKPQPAPAKRAGEPVTQTEAVQAPTPPEADSVVPAAQDASPEQAAQDAAKETGLTFDGEDLGGVNMEGMPPELVAQMPKKWAFTMREKGNPYEATTFYTKAGATAEEIKARWEAKKLEMDAADKAKPSPPPVVTETKERPLDALTTEEKAARWKAIQEKIRKQIAEKEVEALRRIDEAKDADAIRFEDPNQPGAFAIVSRDPGDGSKWRATRFDDRGPSGHLVYDTMEEAIRDFSGRTKSMAAWGNWKMTEVRRGATVSAESIESPLTQPSADAVTPSRPKVTKSKTFQQDGIWKVEIDGQQFEIFRDPETTNWYENERREDGSWVLASTGTKEEAIRHLNDKYGKKPQAAKPATAAEPPAPQAKPVPEAKPAEPAPEPPAGDTALNPEQYPTQEIPVSQLSLSKDVPNFKADADEHTGVVSGQKLSGKYRRLPGAPIVVWERLDGRKEVITGRHRLDLARRNGEKTIPAQVVREVDGFTKDKALIFDAEANIQDGQGTVEDYATYFKNSNLSEAEAQQRGLRGRAKSDSGWHLGKNASDDLYALWRSGKVTEAQAVAIAKAAPGRADVQALGARQAIKGKSAGELGNFIKAVDTQTEGGRADQIDMFGRDDSALLVAEQMAVKASEIQRSITEKIRAVQGAAKNPEAAAKLGVKVKDPQGLAAKLAELKAELARWSNWPQHPELVKRVREGIVPEAKALKMDAPESVAEQKAREEREQAERKAKAAKQEMLDKQNKPLVGTTGDIGQKDMFGGGDLLSSAGKPAAGEKSGKSTGAQASVEGTAELPFAPPSKNPQPLTSAATKNPLTKEVKPISQIIRDIAKGLGTPIQFGRLRFRAGGYYLPKINLIAAKFKNHMPIVSHEAGHRLDEVFGFRKDPAVAAELDHLGDNSTPGSMSSWTNKKSRDYKLGEGVAEFARYWLTNPVHAKSVAPNMFAKWEQTLEANPDYANWLRRAQEDIIEYRAAPDIAKLKSHISRRDPLPKSYSFRRLFRDLVNDLHILNLATDTALKSGTVDPSKNPYLLARNLRGNYGMSEVMIAEGMVDFHTREVTKGTSYEDALKPVQGSIEDFEAYIVARRAKEMHAQGKETGIPMSEIDAGLKAFGSRPEFIKAFDDIKKWQEGLLKYAVDSGLLSPSAAKEWRQMNDDYVPFHRVMEVAAGEAPVQTSGGTGRGLSAGTPGSFKKQKGGVEDIISPLETMLKNAHVIITASEKNSIHVALADLSGRADMGQWVRRIGRPKEAVQLELKRIREQLEDAGADVSMLPDDMMLMFYKASGRAPFGENIIAVKRGDALEFYQLEKDLFETFHSLDYEVASALIRKAAIPAQILRAGVTSTPDFAVFNAIRDVFTSAITSKYTTVPFLNIARGLGALINNPKVVAEWAASGGRQSIETHFFDRDKLQSYLRKKIVQDLTLAERATIIAKSPLTALRSFTGTLEEATRIGEYMIGVKKLTKKGMAIGDARRQAAYDSRDLQDFAKGGAQTKILRMVVPFWNAGLQGNMRLAEAFRNRPGQTILKGFAWVTIPKLIEQALNWDDEDYWDRPQWERDLFFLLPYGKDENGKTKFVRLPTPFEVGVIFGTLPGRILQAWRQSDPSAAAGWVKVFGKMLVPNAIPHAILINQELQSPQGYSGWRNRPIVPESLKDEAPELQYTEQNSLASRHLGSTLNYSPAKIDYAIQGLTGGMGKFVTHQIMDRVISQITGEERTAHNQGFFGRFVTTPAGTSSDAVEKFYDLLTKARHDTSLAKVGRKTGGKEEFLSELESSAKEMAELRKDSRSTRDPAARQRIQLRMMDVAKQAVKDTRR